jgi:hypothetical protein
MRYHLSPSFGQAMTRDVPDRGADWQPNLPTERTGRAYPSGRGGGDEWERWRKGCRRIEVEVEGERERASAGGNEIGRQRDELCVGVQYMSAVSCVGHGHVC